MTAQFISLPDVSVASHPIGGDIDPPETLSTAVYVELRQLAANQMRREPEGQTLQPTALVHEAWLRLGGQFGGAWNSRGHFLSAAAEAMRRILVERARHRRRIRHGGDWKRLDWESLDVVNLAESTPDDALLPINEALEKFAILFPEQCQLIQLRFFAGLSIADAAMAMNISPTTAKRHWAFSRAWLLAELKAVP